MFTGIVERMGRVCSIRETPAGRRLVVDPGPWSYRPAPGDSIAVDGCCLTVAEPMESGNPILVFDVIPQTLQRTTLGDLAAGDQVHLEHAVTPATLLGGHLVQGHVDGVAEVVGVERANGEWRVSCRPPGALMPFIVPRGSVALSGVSLTVAAVRRDAFEVALIPTTLARTTLGSKAAGDVVNLEVDHVARIVVNWLEHRGIAFPPTE